MQIQWPIRFKQPESLPAPPKGEVAWGLIPAFNRNGAKFEEPRHDDLVERRGDGVYLEMMDDDQVSAAVDMFHAAVVTRPWHFVVEDEDAQTKIQDVLTANINSLRGTLKQLLLAMMTARVEGYAPVEKVYGTFEHEGKSYWGITEFKLRPAATFSVETDKYENMLGLIQQQGDTEAKLDPRRFIWFVFKPEHDRFYGRSALRPAYDHYWAKKNIASYWNIYMERAAGGFTLAKVTGAELQEPNKSNLRSILTNIRSSMGIMMPAGVDMEYILPPENTSFEQALRFRNQAIARALLLPSLVGFAEQGSTGSYSQAQIQFEAWLYAIELMTDALADTLNEQLFREITVWNFGASARAPLFAFDIMTLAQKEKLLTLWTDAVEKGVVVNTLEDEQRTRSLLEYSARDEDDWGLDADENNPKNKEPQIPPSEGSPKDSPAGTPPASEGAPDDLEGKNPLGSARSWSAYAQGKPDKASTSWIKEEIYQRRAEELGQQISAILNSVRIDFTRDIIAGGKATPERADLAELTLAIRDSMMSTYREGIASARDALKAKGRDAERTEDRLSGASPLSHMGEFAASRFALDPQTAAQYIAARAAESSKGIIADQIYAEVQRIMTKGLPAGKSVEEMVEEALRTLEPWIGTPDDVGKEITLGNLAPRVATTVRTLMTEAFNEGRRQLFEAPELDGYVEAYEYSAILDERTTRFCKEADGRIWPVASEQWRRYVPPNHFNCRSLLIPITLDDDWETSADVPAGIEPAPGFG